VGLICLAKHAATAARRFILPPQAPLKKLELIENWPPSVESILDGKAPITRFRQNYRTEFGAAGPDDPLYEAISAGRKHQRLPEHWMFVLSRDA